MEPSVKHHDIFPHPSIDAAIRRLGDIIDHGQHPTAWEPPAGFAQTLRKAQGKSRFWIIAGDDHRAPVVGVELRNGAAPGETIRLDLSSLAKLIEMGCRITFSGFSANGQRPYVSHSVPGKRTRVLARTILDLPPGQKVRHADGDWTNVLVSNLVVSDGHPCSVRTRNAGEAHHAAKLRDDEVHMARWLTDRGADHAEVAAALGVSPRTIATIAARGSWRSLPEAV